MGEISVSAQQTVSVRAKNAVISEFAKQLRFRVKRVKRHLKPNVYQTQRAGKILAAKKGTAKEMLSDAEREIQASADEFDVDDQAGIADIGTRGTSQLEDLANPTLLEDRGRRNGTKDDKIDADCDVLDENVLLDCELVPTESTYATKSSEVANGSPMETALLDHRKGMLTDGLSEVSGKGPADGPGASGFPIETRARTHIDTRENREFSAYGSRPSRAGSLSVSMQDGCTMSETQKLELKERTVLETLLPDEPAGFSFDVGSDGGSEHVSRQQNGRLRKRVPDAGPYCNRKGESESDVAESNKRAEYPRSVNGFSPCSPYRGANFADQVPSVLCDAEGNVWHIGKRSEEALEAEDPQLPGPPKARYKEQRSVTLEQQTSCPRDSAQEEVPASGLVPYSHLVKPNWKYPVFDGTSADLPSNPMVRLKERSIFVGCIPDGIENLEQILQDLMDKFLERFDFAPASLGLIQVVKLVKDFAFIELACDKVAQVVLAANQLDVFEWGVNGYHFNIQGCVPTTTSVRASAEYLPLKPARVIYVGNIPKAYWRTDYIEEFFTRMLHGSDDELSSLRLVVHVYLLPDSSDAYVELASEVMADAVIFKCTKNPEILKDIGEEVLLCRDASSIPLMSRHKAALCPQRALFVGITPRGEAFKIDSVVKLFMEILPYIARKKDQPGYLEFVCIQPGKDYAFFQFSSEAFVDAVMDEYMENTHSFLCRTAFILLRLPEYVRPAARYHSGAHRRAMAVAKQNLLFSQGYGSGAKQDSTPSEVSSAPRRFGDEPVKKPDRIVSLGASPPPSTSWNGLSFNGGCSSESESMVIVQGLPKGFNYKLVRGALNELFERILCDSGLLEVGMMVVRYLDRQGHFEFVASLPSPEFVHTLLLVESTFVVAGVEIRLEPLEPRAFEWRANSAEFSGGPCELSSLSDEDSQGRMVVKNCSLGGWPTQKQQKTPGGRFNVGQHPPGSDTAVRGSFGGKNALHDLSDEWDNDDTRQERFYPKKRFRGNAQGSWMGGASDPEASWPGVSGSTRSIEDLYCHADNARVRMTQLEDGNAMHENDYRNGEAGPRLGKSHAEGGLRIVSREGKRIIKAVGGPCHEEGGGPIGMSNLFVRKRKYPIDGRQCGPGYTMGSGNKMRNGMQFL